MTETPLQLGPFWGGTRYDLAVEECKPYELYSMENARLGKSANAEQRPGTDSYQDAAALGGTPTTTFSIEFKPDTTNTYVALIAGAAIYKYDSGWSAITGGVTITAGDDNTFEGVDANGTLVMTNGVDTDAIKWTGSGNAAALDDNGRFSKGAHIAWFDNRLWIGNVNGATNQLWYSDTADIETWGATSFFNFGGRITGLCPVQNALAVHTTVGIFTVVPTGNADLPYLPNPNAQTTEAGIDGRSCESIPGDIMLLVREEGVYEWRGGAELEKVSDALDGERYWDNINTSRLHQAHSLHVPQEGRVYFVFPYGSSQTNPNHVMIYDYRKRTEVHGKNVGAWYGPDTGWERNCGALIDGKPHFGDFGGILWDHAIALDAADSMGATDDGAAYPSHAETGAPAPLGGGSTVGFVSARVWYTPTGIYDLTVQQKGSELVADPQLMDLTGAGLILDNGELLDDGNQWGIDEQMSQDIRLVGYGSTSSLRVLMNAAGQHWSVFKTLIQFENMGQPTKPKPVDA